MASIKKKTTKKTTTKAKVWTTINLEILGAANGYVLKEDQVEGEGNYRVIRTVFASTDALLVALEKPLRDIRDCAQNGDVE